MNRFELARDLQAMVMPGQSIVVSDCILREIDCIPGWSQAESVMENIIGAYYEWSFERELTTLDVVFHRRHEPLTDGRRTYVSPDRRHLFEQRGDGLWYRKD